MLDAVSDNGTAIGEAFERTTGRHSRAGMQLFYAWHLPLTRYCDKGGSLSELRDIFDRLVAESSLNDDADGATDAVLESAIRQMPAASSPQANGSSLIENARMRPQTYAPPVREPSIAQRNSAGMVALEIAVTIFDTFKIRDGRAIGDVRYGELFKLENAGRVEAAVFNAIRKHGQAPHDAKVRHIIKPKVLQTIIRNATEKYNVS